MFLSLDSELGHPKGAGPLRSPTPEEILGAASEALYDSERSGRNRVTPYGQRSTAPDPGGSPHARS